MKNTKELIYKTLVQDITDKEKEYLKDVIKTCKANQKLLFGKLRTKQSFYKELEILGKFNQYQETIDIIENKLRYIWEKETQLNY